MGTHRRARKRSADLEVNMTLVTVKDAVKETGLSERTIRRWMSDGKLPYVRIGSSQNPPVRIRRRDLLALVRPGESAA